jgi:hypothetical protein
MRKRTPITVETVKILAKSAALPVPLAEVDALAIEVEKLFVEIANLDDLDLTVVEPAFLAKRENP